MEEKIKIEYGTKSADYPSKIFIEIGNSAVWVWEDGEVIGFIKYDGVAKNYDGVIKNE